MILKKEPDLIISDIMMPEMDGLTLCKKIKQNVTINHIPIILLTAKSREEDNLEGLNMGADAYIVKPFSIEILRKTAINLIKSREVLRNSFSGSQMQEQKLKKLKVQSPDDRLLNKVMKVINDNLGNPDLNVEMIATEVGISRVHLHRKLKELTNGDQGSREFWRPCRRKCWRERAVATARHAYVTHEHGRVRADSFNQIPDLSQGYVVRIPRTCEDGSRKSLRLPAAACLLNRNN